MSVRKLYRLESYLYDLDPKHIAMEPPAQRTDARLMILDRKTQTISHDIFKNIQTYLRPNDLLVFNNSRVRKARFYGTRIPHGGEVEIVILPNNQRKLWTFMAKPAKRLQAGVRLKLPDDMELKILSKEKNLLKGRFVRTFEDNKKHSAKALPLTPKEVEQWLERRGELPLPPYIKKKLIHTERYQTVYSKKVGSSAAPTAGLHFDKSLFKKLRKKGIKFTKMELRIGMGTFTPVRSKDIRDHVMHKEWYKINKTTETSLNLARNSNRRIISVGTTSLRGLESNFKVRKRFYSTKEFTQLFIHPPARICSIDGLITNFHLPGSTLLMMVAAFADLDFILKAYQEAMTENYRFYSFGDSMMIL